MFRKITNFRQDSGIQLDRHHSQYENFEEAKSAGLHDACLNSVISVQIWDDKYKLVASWSNLDNHWFDYRNKNGKFIPAREYFENNRKTIERFAIAQDFNIRIRKHGGVYKVYAADHVIPVEAGMLSWVMEAVDEAQIRQEREADQGVDLSNREILDIFSEYLTKRIKAALVTRPENWTSLRRSPVFK